MAGRLSRGILNSEMALLPNIPTSFVPRASAAAARPQSSLDIGDALGILSYLVLVIMFVLSLALFLYGRILTGQLASKDAALAKAEAAIDPATVQGFVQLRDRLNSSQQLLSGHVAPSRFFSVLESILPTTVRFSSLHMSIDSADTVKVEGTGTSKSFNALSAASAAFATDTRIKNVIFSKMTISQKDNSVSFSFSATIDPKLISFVPGEPSQPVTASSTPL